MRTVRERSMMRKVGPPAVVAAAVAIAMACARLGDIASAPGRVLARVVPFAGGRASQSGSAKDARKVIGQAIRAGGGLRAWKALEGLEFQMTIETYEGGRVTKDPALVQMAIGGPRQIRIHYSKVDQTFGLGDQGPWALLRGNPDRNPVFVARAHFTTVLMNFMISAPFNLAEKWVLPQSVEQRVWGGDVFDAVTVGFRRDGYPWPGDSMTLWFKRPDLRLDRCFFVSTAEGTAFGRPPNYLWIFWRDYQRLDGIPFASRWSFYRSDDRQKLGERLFDMVVERAFTHRSFLPVLFREPIIEPRIRRLPAVRRPTTTSLPIIPVR